MPRAGVILGAIGLDRLSRVPLQRQLYVALREAILSGRLGGGARLPASRLLACELGIGRNTVVAVFEQLAAEGYVTARVGDGTRVARVLPERHLEARRPSPRRPAGADGAPGASAGAQAVTRVGAPAMLSRRGEAIVATVRPGPWIEPIAFQTGRAAYESFPLEVWARLLARRARRPQRGTMGYAHPAGLPALREALAAHLGAARGVSCTPEQVIVVAGAQAGLDLACRLLGDAGDPAWLEDPGYPGARGAMLAAGLRPVAVPVDAEGLDVAAGARRCPRARLVHVTPSHQFPLGVTMTLARRLALLDWAARSGAWLLEDDYDSEFRYAGRPLAAMQGIDPGGRVVHVGAFSKTLFASLRVGWLVVPRALAAPFASAIRHTGHTVPASIQAALADFLVEGHFSAHLRRMRVLYAGRQARLVGALRRRSDVALGLDPPPAGMQMPVLLPLGWDDMAASRAALDAGVVAAPLSAYWHGAGRRPGLLLGFAGVPEREIDRGVERLVAALGRPDAGGPDRPGPMATAAVARVPRGRGRRAVTAATPAARLMVP